MKKRYSALYFLKQSLVGMMRNGVMSAASVFVLAACLVIMGSFSLLLVSIDYNINQIEDLDKVVIFLDDGADPSVIASKLEEITNIDSYIYISKEDALIREKERYKDYPEIFQPLGENNPYPDSFEITYSDLDGVQMLVYQLSKIDGVDENVRNNLEISEAISSLKRGITMVFIWFWGLIFIVSVFVIINTIKISVHTRKNEIEIMRYIGASNWFVVLPFILEGVFIGIISALVAYPVQWYIYKYAMQAVVKDINFILLMNFSSFAGILAIAFAGIAVIIGVFSSAVSVKKYSKIGK